MLEEKQDERFQVYYALVNSGYTCSRHVVLYQAWQTTASFCLLWNIIVVVILVVILLVYSFEFSRIWGAWVVVC